MHKSLLQFKCWTPVLTAAFLMMLAAAGYAGPSGIDGIEGLNTFSFTVKQDIISTVDGGNYLIWGYADNGGHNNGRAQYPGPTIIVNQGETLTFQLKNGLIDPAGNPVSMIFPGQENVTATGGIDGEITKESKGPGDIVTYSFTASRPGTKSTHGQYGHQSN